jgi:hypothetical protein
VLVVKQIGRPEDVERGRRSRAGGHVRHLSNLLRKLCSSSWRPGSVSAVRLAIWSKPHQYPEVPPPSIRGLTGDLRSLPNNWPMCRRREGRG